MKRKVLCILMALTVLFSLIVVPVSAEIVNSGTYGTNLTWELDNEGTLTIRGTGEMPDYANRDDVPWYSLRSNIKNVVIENGVENISYYAFYDCISLTKVTIPNSVKSIRFSAFFHCISLTKITIPNSVTSIEAWAFGDCTSLISITIPDSVTYIGWCAFEGTAWYNNQTDGVVYLGKFAYKYKGTMPSNTNITLVNGTMRIAYGTFQDCTNLTSVTIPDSVKSIGDFAFGNCTSLTKVTIPNGVTNIGGGAFLGCTSLTEITIPNSITNIGESAFFDCTSLTDVYYGGTQENWFDTLIEGNNEPLMNAVIHFVEKEPDQPTGEYVIGDLNGDGKVTALDNIILARHLAGWKGYETLPYSK